MIEFEKPIITKIDENKDYGKFVIEPLERGYGTTLGNSLHQFLLLLVFQTQSFIILPRNEPCVLLLLKITHDDVLEDDNHYVVQVLHHGLLLLQDLQQQEHG